MATWKYRQPTIEQQDAAAVEGKAFGQDRYFWEGTNRGLANAVRNHLKKSPHLTGYYDLEDIFTDQAYTANKGK
jgi:hypothetical protein